MSVNMSGYTIERQKGRAFRDQIINLVRSRYQHSRNYHFSFHQKLPALYDAFRGMMRLRRQAWRNDAHIPIILSICLADTAAKVQALFSGWPYVTFTGYGPDDMPIARKQEALVSAEWEDMRILNKAYDIFFSSSLYGVAVMQHGWQYREGQRVVADTVRLPVSGELKRTSHLVTVPDYDGPTVEVLDLLDVFTQPGFRGIHEGMQWVVIRRQMDFDTCQELAAQGVFDSVEVEKCHRGGGESEAAFDYFKQARFSHLYFNSPESMWRTEPYGRPVELLEMWGFVPEELTDDGVKARVITIANGQYIFRNDPNPYWHGEIPLLDYSPNPDPHCFFPVGKAEMAMKIQIAANRFTNQQLDALDLLLNSPMLYNEMSGLDPEQCFLEPGRMIGMNGPVGPDALRPLYPDLRGMEFGTAKTNELWMWAQRGTGGPEDAMMGIGQPGTRESARSALQRGGAAGRRQLTECMLAETMFIEPFANVCMALNQQYLSTPREIFILGDSANSDPVTGAQIIMAREQVTDYDLVPRYAARARGAASALNQVTRLQDKLQFMALATQNPYVSGAVNWINFFRDVMGDMGIKNVNEILSTQEEYQRMKEIAATGGQAGQPGLPRAGLPAGAQMDMAAMSPGAPMM